MARHGKKDIDEKLLMALACGASVEVAARTVDVSARTVYRRLADAAFRRRLQQLRADMVQRTSGMLTAAGGEGVKTLIALLKDSVSATVRLGAARSVIELGVKLRESVELEERLQALEERIAAGGGWQHR